MVPDRDRASTYELIRDRFKLTVMENPATDPASQGESILHSDRLALVDRGRIIGLFDSKDPAALDSLLAQAKSRASPAWIRVLPSVNASLNALCALFLVLGWILIGEGPGRPRPVRSGSSPIRPLLANPRIDESPRPPHVHVARRPYVGRVPGLLPGPTMTTPAACLSGDRGPSVPSTSPS